MFTKDIGIDLGTANTLVYMRGKGIIIREPSVVAVNTRTDKCRYVGKEAKDVIGRTPGSIVAVRPLKDGVIADFDIATTMLQEFIKGKRAFYYQARKADEKDNLTAFSREYRRFRGMDEHVRYDTFADAFESIATDARSQRMILIIDEIAYLCQKNQSLLSLLQFLWMTPSGKPS